MRVDRRVHAAYAIGVGLFVAGFWAALALTGGIPELRTAPLEFGYHLVAELATAAVLVASGGALVAGRRWGRHLYAAALGMLLYTVVNSAGYYAQQGEVAMVGMFTVLTLATLGLLADHLAGGQAGDRPTGGRPGRGRPDEVDL